jgi:hypothetical protein
MAKINKFFLVIGIIFGSLMIAAPVAITVKDYMSVELTLLKLDFPSFFKIK